MTPGQSVGSDGSAAGNAVDAYAPESSGIRVQEGAEPKINSQKEIGRLTDLLSTPQLSTQAGENQPPTNRISDRTFKVLSDDALVNFGRDQKGDCASRTVDVTIPENAADLLDGKAFLRPAQPTTGRSITIAERIRAQLPVLISRSAFRSAFLFRISFRDPFRE